MHINWFLLVKGIENNDFFYRCAYDIIFTIEMHMKLFIIEMHIKLFLRLECI